MSTDFATRLLHARSCERLTQAELAEKAGLPSAAISHFETGRREPSLKNIRRLCTALGYSADWLLGMHQYGKSPADNTEEN